MNRRTFKQQHQRVKKRKTILKWFSLTLIFLVSIFIFSLVLVKKSEAAEEVIVSSEIYPELNLKTTTREAELYNLFVSQPYTENEEIDTYIEEWINQERDEFTEVVQEAESMLKENDFSAHLNIQTATIKLPNKLYSLELEAYQIASGANGSAKIKPIVIDLQTNQILKKADILLEDEESLAEIKSLIIEKLQKNSDINEYLFEDLIEEELENNLEWKVSVHPEAILFYFDESEIAAAAAGIIQVDIPMTEIIYYLNPAFAEKIGIDIPEKQIELQPDGKYIALTFDDGPHAVVTPRILETLAQHNAKATFYMLGSQVEYYPSIAKQVLAEGHELGDHTMSHKDLTRLGSAQIKTEIENSSNHIRVATGELPRTLRPPYGAFNSEVATISNQLALPVIMWSVDSLDWKSRNVTAINQEVMSAVHPGAIVLLHDIHATTAYALPQLLTNLENEGYEFITVSQLLEFGEIEGVGPYHGIN